MSNHSTRTPWLTVVDRTQMHHSLGRLNIHMSPTGLDQILNGQSLTNPDDRQNLARLLTLVAGPGASPLIGLMLPAVQKTGL